MAARAELLFHGTTTLSAASPQFLVLTLKMWALAPSSLPAAFNGDELGPSAALKPWLAMLSWVRGLFIYHSERSPCLYLGALL